MSETFNFKVTKATKEATPPLIALWGQSGTGKTMSALRLARGIVGDKGKIFVLDTENGRAKFYADEVGGWMHLDLQPPFSPEKYSAAFRFLEDQGADIIVVDSMSHVWEGEGGILDIADNGKSAKGYELQGLAKWKKPKTQYKRMINNLLRAPIPVIFCVRAKEKFIQEKDDKGNDKLRSDGYVPIMDKNFIYEMTVSLHMTGNGMFDQNVTDASKTSKINRDMRPCFLTGKPVSEEMGKCMMEVLGGVDKTAQELIKMKRDGADAAMHGTDKLKAWFDKLTNDQKATIKPEMDRLKQDAAKVDAEPATKEDEETDI